MDKMKDSEHADLKNKDYNNTAVAPNMQYIIESGAADKVLEKTQPFIELMMMYQCALREVRTKFEVLNDEFSVRYNRNPVESIKTRIKTPISIIDKLKRHSLPYSLQSIRDNISDVAGVRIICSFPDDIYELSKMFLKQDDIKLITMKDYIRNPKPNGYRSLHLIVEIPIFLTDRTEHMRVEVQFRTIAMDFWASLEHKLRYKKSINDTGNISSELRECAEQIAALDVKMQDIHKEIENHR